MGFRIGVDIGGTFTDIVVVADDGEVRIFKTPTTPKDPAIGFREGVEIAAKDYGMGVTELLSKCGAFVHGATVATNTFLQKTGAEVGLITTEGHRDTLYFRDGYKPERFNLLIPPPTPMVPRYLRLPVRERINYEGKVMVPLDENSVFKAARKFKQEGVEAIAVCLLWSTVNPDHERRVKEIIKKELPEVHTLLSSDVLPILREWPRTCATVLSAYVFPGSQKYLTDLEEYLQSHGYKQRLLLAQCSGGLSTVDVVLENPVNLMGSGPALGPTAGLFYAKKLGIENFITMDMGGTSFDVCAVTGGVIHMSKEARVEDVPLGVPAVDVYSIGAGGGSVAWIDPGGALRVGPTSMGADPGPACYALGGEEPTVTDAFVVLGYMDPDYFLGGNIKLKPQLAERAINEKIAKPLKMGLVEAASAIYEIVCDNMATGIKAISISRGVDPRDYVLIVGGGAGPIVAWRLAQKVGIKKVLIPKNAAIFCAFGMVCSNLRHDSVYTYPMNSTDLDFEKVNEIYNTMESELITSLEKEGVAREKISLERTVDSRYVGQLREIAVPLSKGWDVQELANTFHQEHEHLYSYARKDTPIEFFHWRCTAIGELPTVAFPERPYAGLDASSALKGKRKAHFAKIGYVEVNVYDGDKLMNGMMVDGPATLELPTTTLLIGVGQQITVNKYGDYECKVNVLT